MESSGLWMAIWFVGFAPMAFFTWYESILSGQWKPWTFRGVLVYRTRRRYDGAIAKTNTFEGGLYDQVVGQKVLVRAKAVNANKGFLFTEFSYGLISAPPSVWMPFRGVILNNPSESEFVLKVYISWTNVLVGLCFTVLATVQLGLAVLFPLSIYSVMLLGIGGFVLWRYTNFMDLLTASMATNSVTREN